MKLLPAWNWKLSMQQDYTLVDSALQVLDKTWTWRDPNGHLHRGSDLDATSRARYEPCYCDLDAPGHRVFRDRICRRCGVQVHPRLVPAGPTTVPGLREATLEVYDVDPENPAHARTRTWSLSWSSATRLAQLGRSWRVQFPETPLLLTDADLDSLLDAEAVLRSTIVAC